MCLRGQIYADRLAEKAFWLPATRGSKKDSQRAVTPAEEAVRVRAHLALPGSLQAKQLCHLHAQLWWGQSCQGKKKSCVCVRRFASVQLCGPADYGLPGFYVRGVLQARILEYIGQYWCHALLEPYISCCPSRQPPWGPGAASTPATPAAAPPPHLALTGANPRPPGQPQEQTPVDGPHAEVEIKTTIEIQGQCG